MVRQHYLESVLGKNISNYPNLHMHINIEYLILTTTTTI